MKKRFFDQLSFHYLSKYSPLVEVRASSVSGAGEGVFMRRGVEADTVVSFYNGVRLGDAGSDDWDECSYRIFITKEEEEGDQDLLDIPAHLRDVSHYCATLAHKEWGIICRKMERSESRK